MNSEYDKISKESARVLYSLGSGIALSRFTLAELEQAAMEVRDSATDMDIIRALTHDDPSYLNEGIFGMLYQRARKIPAAELMAQVYQLYGDVLQDAFLSFLHTLVEIHPEFKGEIHYDTDDVESLREGLSRGYRLVEALRSALNSMGRSDGGSGGYDGDCCGG